MKKKNNEKIIKFMVVLTNSFVCSYLGLGYAFVSIALFNFNIWAALIGGGMISALLMLIFEYRR